MTEGDYKVHEGLLQEFGDIVKFKLDSAKPADIEPLYVNLKLGAAPVRTKQRRHPKEKLISWFVTFNSSRGFVLIRKLLPLSESLPRLSYRNEHPQCIALGLTTV